MKKSAKIAVLSLVGVLALGGTATAIAFTVKAAKKDGSAAVDKEYLELTFADRETTFGDINLEKGSSIYKQVKVNIDKTAVTPGDFNIVYTYNTPSDVTISIYGENPDIKGEGAKPKALITLAKGGTLTYNHAITLTEPTFTSYVEFTCPSEATTIGGQLNIKLEAVEAAPVE